MKIASWNVNSVKARLPNVLRWLEEAQPDIACLQELKCVDDAFPRDDIEALGYNVETHGQKTYNGVALLSTAARSASSHRYCAEPRRKSCSVLIATTCAGPSSSEYHGASSGAKGARYCRCVGTPHSPPESLPL